MIEVILRVGKLVSVSWSVGKVLELELVHMNDMFRQQQAKKPEGNCGKNNGDTLHCTAEL